MPTGTIILLISIILVVFGWLRGPMAALGLVPATAVALMGALLAGRYVTISSGLEFPWGILQANMGGLGMLALAIVFILGPYSKGVQTGGIIALLASGAAAWAIFALLPRPFHTLPINPAFFTAAAAGTAAYLLAGSETVALASALGGPPLGDIFRLASAAGLGFEPVHTLGGIHAFDAGLMAAVISGVLVQVIGAPVRTRLR